jgi:hypothetical protein
MKKEGRGKNGVHCTKRESRRGHEYDGIRWDGYVTQGPYDMTDPDFAHKTDILCGKKAFHAKLQVCAHANLQQTCPAEGYFRRL